jgi:voltage-gated potassium channel
VSQLRQFRGPLIVLVLVLALGVAGYTLIECWSFLDALYMTVITVTTVGYGEVHPLSPYGRIFTIVLIVTGTGAVLYTFTALFGWLVSTDWGERRRRQQMEERISRMRHHFILCGYGRVGRAVASVLRRERAPFVVVDVNQVSIAVAETEGLSVVYGDAASDDVLRRAGIERAQGLITAVDSDAENVYVVLSARGLRPDLLIVARATAEDAIKKLERAGATHVLSPYALAGQRMAMLAVRPAAVELVETLLYEGQQSLVLEEVKVQAGSALEGTIVGELRQRFPEGPVFVALRSDGRLKPSPSNDYRLQANDTLVLVGSPEQLAEIEGLS